MSKLVQKISKNPAYSDVTSGHGAGKKMAISLPKTVKRLEKK